MSRNPEMFNLTVNHVPRASGDEPELEEAKAAGEECSPRERG